MKQNLFAFLAIMLAFSAVMATSPQPALAVGSESWLTPGADPSLKVETVNVDEAALTATAWMQQFSEGIHISKPNKICYPFRQGNFHWVPQIFQLSGTIWSKVETTKETISGPEGALMACASPTEAGTYALFAYYTGPVEKKVVLPPDDGEQFFDVDSWTITTTPNGNGLDVSLVRANDVNWSGYYPTATKLAWGIRMCMDSSCNNNIEGTKSISAGTYPYPQNFDATIFSDSNQLIYFDSETICEYRPFVELLDASNNVLDIIYYEGYADYCMS